MIYISTNDYFCDFCMIEEFFKTEKTHIDEELGKYFSQLYKTEKDILLKDSFHRLDLN